MAKEILCAFGVDVDAVAGWLGSYGGEDSPDDISRGMFAGEVGAPRLLDLFARRDMTTTWFWPGHSIETFPDQFRRCADAGHEIGVHGYSHENPIAMSREQESAVLDRSIELITEVTDRRPTGPDRRPTVKSRTDRRLTRVRTRPSRSGHVLPAAPKIDGGSRLSPDPPEAAQGQHQSDQPGPRCPFGLSARLSSRC